MYEGAEGRNSRGTPGHCQPLPALIHWEVKVGGRSMKDVGGAVLAGSSPPFLGRERAAVDVDVGPERRSPRYHETCFLMRERWVLLKIPRGDIDGVK